MVDSEALLRSTVAALRARAVRSTVPAAGCGTKFFSPALVGGRNFVTLALPRAGQSPREVAPL